MTDLSTAPASDMDSPADHDEADVNDVGDVGERGAPAVSSQPDTASSVLARLEDDGWRSLHSRTAPGQRSIDHIAIGPSGIFVIDNHVLDAAGSAGQPSASGSISEATITAANQLADAVRQLLPPLTRQYIVPVLAYVASAPMSISRGPVQICTTSMLQRVIQSRPDALSSREIDEVSSVLSAGLGGPTASAKRTAPAVTAPTTAPQESGRAVPKRRKLGWRGGQSDNAAAAVDPAPQEPTAWPAVTPPPVWEPAETSATVAPPPLSVEPAASATEPEALADEPDTLVAEPEWPSAVIENDAASSWDDLRDDVHDVYDDGAPLVDAAIAAPVAAEESEAAGEPALSLDVEATEDVLATDEQAHDGAVNLDSAELGVELDVDVLPEPDLPAAYNGSDEAETGADVERTDAVASSPEHRDPFVGSFPVGWINAAEVADTGLVEDVVPEASAVEVEHVDEVALNEIALDRDEIQPVDSVDEAAASPYTSPWPTIDLPGLASVDEPDLRVDIDSDHDHDQGHDHEFDAGLQAEPHDEPAAVRDPGSSPTPVGRTQPGGRRRAPVAPWHERLTRTRAKTRPEGGRRVAPVADAPSVIAEVADASTSLPAEPSAARSRSRRSSTARPRTLSARNVTTHRENEPKRAARRVKRTPARGDDAVSTAAAATSAPPAGLSSRGQKMYAAMSARQANGLDDGDDEPTNVGAPIRRLITVGIAAGLIVVAGTHVTGISSWVADHVHIPGVGDTSGKHHPKDGDPAPGRSADLQPPDSGGKGDSSKHPKP